uniref:Uncharacterized protein n=1 Tax=Hippocampus comes TaxID=109280 RepID=A0A3Q2XLW1_HIPCM
MYSICKSHYGIISRITPACMLSYDDGSRNSTLQMRGFQHVRWRADNIISDCRTYSIRTVNILPAEPADLSVGEPMKKKGGGNMHPLWIRGQLVSSV